MRSITFIFALSSILLSGCVSDHARSGQGAQLLSVEDAKPGSTYEVGVYVLAKGDTMAKICMHYQMTIREFEELNPELWNNRTQNGIYVWKVGQQVRVYEITKQENSIFESQAGHQLEENPAIALPPGSSNQTSFDLKEKVLSADLIVVARIRGEYGSHLLNTELKDPRVIWGRKESNTTLVVLQAPTPLSLSVGPDVQWIFFLRKTTKTRGNLEYHLLVGGDEDYNGMQIATEDHVQEVIHLVKQLKLSSEK